MIIIKQLVKILVSLALVASIISCDQITKEENEFIGVENFQVENPEVMHFVLLSVIDDEENKIDQAKIEISAYNRKYHKINNIKITDIFLNQETNSKVILLRRFDNKFAALDYISGTKKNAYDYINTSEVAYDIFAITQANYRKVIKQKSIDNYKMFYEKRYLD